MMVDPPSQEWLPFEVEESESLTAYADGRDELNFAEFPICTVSSYKRRGEQQIIFEDSVTDSQSGKQVQRRLTVTGNEQFGGLPTSVDDEILLGLIQLTRLAGFTSRTVRFSRYDLLKILGWKDSTKNYRRIEEALNRWRNIDLSYQNSWWDKEEKAWVSEKFSVLDYVRLYHKEAGMSPHQCEISWSAVVFRSFRAGNVKRLDFQHYKVLELPIAKRMLRFLDKRFYKKRRWSFDLLDFAYNKIGLSKTYTLSQIKRRLADSLIELETTGFLVPMDEEQRYKKAGKGKWLIFFERGEDPVVLESEAEEANHYTELATLLIERGVSSKRAQRFVDSNPAEYIEAKIELLEYYLYKGGDSAPKNQGAWLAAAIEDDHQPPKGFTSRAERQKQALEREKRDAIRAEERRKQKEAQKARERAEQEKSEKNRQDALEYRQSLPAAQRAKEDQKALLGTSETPESVAGQVLLLGHYNILLNRET